MSRLSSEIITLLHGRGQCLLALTLSPHVRVKSLKRKGRLQESFSHLVTVSHCDNEVFLLIVRRYRLWSKEIEVHKLIALWKVAEGESLRMAIVQD